MAQIDLARIRRYVKERLSPGLYAHSARTVARARQLAEHHDVDADKAEAAGWLHDFVKAYSRDEIDEAIRGIGFHTLDFGGMPDPVVHGPAGALLVEQELGITDKEVLEAISLHSTADVEMGDIAKILFIADFTEAGHDFPGIEEDRAACLGDLDEAVLHVLSRKIAHVVEHKRVVDQHAWQAYNAFAERVAQRA